MQDLEECFFGLDNLIKREVFIEAQIQQLELNMKADRNVACQQSNITHSFGDNDEEMTP